MTISLESTAKGKIEYSLSGQGKALMPKMMTKIMFKELSTYRPIEFTKEELIELKSITLKMRSYQGFDNDLDQDIDQEILKKIAGDICFGLEKIMNLF